ncbi:tetratricopeptide repeat protein [Candidatus Poribacteria bacterium]|nr:tetratricopeptide repeat protein [Candidatus Poribacteria bacterium]
MMEYDLSTQESLKRLLSSIRLAAKYHRFALDFVECSLSIQQNQYIAHLAQQCDKLGIVLLQLDLSSIIVENLRQTALDFLHEKFPVCALDSPDIQCRVRCTHPDDNEAQILSGLVQGTQQLETALMSTRHKEQIPDNIALVITGLESSILLDSDEEHPAVLQIMNLGRDNYPKSFPHPFIICLSDKMLQKVQRVAPDFWSWRSAEPLRFAVTEDFLEQEITKALSFNQIGSWNDAVTQVSIFERVLEAYVLCVGILNAPMFCALESSMPLLIEALMSTTHKHINRSVDEHNAQTYSELYNNTDTELELLSRLGDAYRFLEKYQKAYNCYLKALRIAENLGNSEKRATILNKLGIVMRETKDLDKALEFFQEPLKFAEERGDLIGQGVALNNMGLIYLDKGEFSDAVKTLERALTINETSNNLQALSNTLGNLGLAHYKQGNIEPAIEYYHRSLEISLKLNDQGSYWKDLLNLGLAYSKKSEYETAFRYYSDAADVSRRAGDLIGEKRCLIHLAQCASLMAKDDSIVFYEEALEIARKIKDNEDEYNILTALADTYRGRGEQERAISYYEEAEKKAQELGDSDRELSCLISLIQLHGRGDPDSVAKYKEQARLILSGAGTLKTKMLNAWLVDDRNQIPGVLKKDKKYTLCLNIGSAPSVGTKSEVETSSFPVANVEFICNLALKRDVRSHEVKGIAKPTETPRPTTTGRSDISVSVQPSDQLQTPISDSDQTFESAGDEHESQNVESNGLRSPNGLVEGEKVSSELFIDVKVSILTNVEVNIEGIGFEVEKSSNTLKTPWEHDSNPLVFPVTPRESGKNELIIKCGANGIPYDTTLSVQVEDSLVDGGEYGLPAPERITAADGAEMALIPAGEFQMGSNDGGDREKPVHTVYLDAFYIDVYPVTNTQYRKFIEATGYPEPQYWNDERFNQPNQPVVGVTWYYAMAYAEWVGKRLPTEAEWEKAARGGLVGKKYPWGDESPDDKRANFDLNVGKTTPVGSYPPNGYGLYDMAGNIWEWCLDEYQSDFYKTSPQNNPLAGGNLSDLLTNYKNIKTRRVLRGGSWVGKRGMRVAFRGKYNPGVRRGYRGFRCMSPRFP